MYIYLYEIQQENFIVLEIHISSYILYTRSKENDDENFLMKNLVPIKFYNASG